MSGIFRFCVKGVSLALMAGLFMLTAPAFAQVAAGCSPETLALQQSVAEAIVSENKALDDEIFVQDDSVLALTCFNQSAAISAQQSGDVFSGDFRADLAPIVDDALSGMYSNFREFSLGGSTGRVDYDSTEIDTASASMTYQCSGIRDLWDTVNNAGVAPGAPYTTRSEMLSDTSLPNSGTRYQSARANEASRARRAQAQAQIDARAPPEPVPTPTPRASPCQVLFDFGGVASATACVSP